MTLPLGVCFDFNGVIVNDERHHCAAFRETLAGAGFALDEPTYYREYLGYDDHGCLRHAARSAGWALDAERFEALLLDKHARYEALIAADCTLVPGVVEFVRALRSRDVRLAIVSAARRSEIHHVLEVAGLADAFATIVAAEDVGATKPDPEGYLAGLARLGLPNDRCVVVEDSLPGLAAARAAGMRVAMLTTSHPRAALEAAGPDRLWDDFESRRPEELPWIPTSS